MPNYQMPYYMNTGVQAPFGYPYQQPMQQPQNQMQMPKVQPTEQIYKQPILLQGKSVDSVEVVKAMDIPLDGSVSYFPLTDGSAIVTKQLQQDGTSKTIIYKPVEENEVEQAPKYLTIDEFKEAMNKMDNTEFETDIKSMKRKINDLMEDIKDIHNSINKRKD